MLDDANNYFEYSRTIKIQTDTSLDTLSNIIDKIEKEIMNFLENELNVRLLEPPIEAEITLEKNTIKVKLNIKLTISPLSQYYPRKKEIATLIAKKFFEKLINKIKGKEDVK